MSNPSDLATLEAMLGEERIQRIEQVLDGRMTGLTVLLEDLHKPQNMGACIRTVEALGLLHVHVVESDTRFVPNPKITQGCHKWIELHRHRDVRAAAGVLRRSGYRLLATSPDAERELDELDFSTPAALCFGNELEGVTDELVAMADETFRIPMFGFTRSFNISVALGICTHVAVRARRRALGADSDLTPAARAAWRDRYLRASRKNADAILAALPTRPGEP